MAEPLSMPEAVYTAESVVLRPVTRRFTNFSQVEDFVEHILSSDWWTTTFPNAPLSVIVDKRSSSARFAVAIDGVIAIPNSPDGRTVAMVLHELAHIATDRVDGHGPIFRTAMLKLVRRYMGFYPFVDLKNQYDVEFRKGLV